MIITWYQLLLGLALGLVAPQLLLQADCRYLSFEDLWTRVVRREPTMTRRKIRWWRTPLVWIDPLRGYLVASLVADGLQLVPEATAEQKLGELSLTTLIYVAAVWVQSAVRVKDRETLSPVLFLAGMFVALFPWTVWGPALLLGAASAVAMNGFVAGYFVTALATLGAGYLFTGNLPALATALAMLSVPVMLNWMRSTRLVMPIRY